MSPDGRLSSLFSALVIERFGQRIGNYNDIRFCMIFQLTLPLSIPVIAFMYSSKHTHSRYWFLATDEEKSPKNLKLLSCFAHSNWQLGDWCLLPSSAYSSPISMEKGMSKLELHGSIYNELNSNPTGSGCDSEEAVVEESNGNKDAMDLEIRSKENVVGKLVRTKHHKEITFPLVINSSESKPISLLIANYPLEPHNQ
ncbi:hypothetical protein Ahy_A07g036401 [Arachis hypogaea]|uniref:Uncharacterized protein n=1 Tax=Arachis hypogaea TaxID=3818 RepID=A0A445CG37_ARAHY|nr:hypothetical protein Ahy_A07g036401 [Arachis hypogaea]